MSAIVTDSCDCYHALTVVLRGGLDTMDGLLINLFLSQRFQNQRGFQEVSFLIFVSRMLFRDSCVCWTDLMHGLMILVSLNY